MLFILRPMMKLYGSSPEATGDGAEDLFPRQGGTKEKVCGRSDSFAASRQQGCSKQAQRSHSGFRNEVVVDA